MGNEGNGFEIRHMDYTEFTAHPDSKSYPDVYRAKLKVHFAATQEDMPSDASKERKALIGKVASELTFFRVDKARKVLQVVGNLPLEEETTTPEKDYFGYKKLELFEAGN